jgi:ribose/xylose/arabinose/galactoside ABC-type transport system permease subunit
MEKGNKLSSFKNVLSSNGALIAMIILFAAGFILFDSFRSGVNIMNILRQTSYMAIMAVGMTFVILTGGIDLSVSSVFGISGVLAALINKNVTDNIIILIVVPIAVCAAIGIINGLIVTKLKITPFIATLAMMMGIKGFGLLISESGQAIAIKNEAFAVIGKGNVAGLPVPVIILIAVTIVAMFVARYTVYGRNCYAIGGNADAVIMKGVNINKTKIMTYMLSASLAGLAGLIIAARSNVGKITIGTGYEMDVVAAVVIGGTLLSGGSGKVLNSVFGMIIITLIGNLITMKGDVSWMWQNVITGVLLIVILIIQSVQIKSGKMLTKRT